MKICVYTITKNEEQFIERWFNSAKDADEILVFDTGSNDKTVEISKKLGIKTIEGFISPWRFDVARNSALSMVSSDVDYCVSLDADEVLYDGWRDHLDNLDIRVTRPRYKYVWSWNPDGSEGLVYGGDKIHSRRGYVWKHPVHEVLMKTREEPEIQGWIDLQILHFPDGAKSRAQYGDMLELASIEDPKDDRIAFYYGRELFYQGKYDEAYNQLKYHLELPTALWGPERSASKRLIAKCKPSEAEYWLLSAASEAPDRREPWVDLSEFYYDKAQWPQCYAAAIRAIAIREKPLEYICDAEAWGAKPYDLAAVSSYNLGMVECLSYGMKAVTIEPGNDRLQGNLEHYRSLVINKENVI